VFNANDVLFSTASLLHLCCISWDRYIAVTDPFNYDRRMTRRRAALTLAGVWTASAALSHIPIHLGLYTTASQRHKLAAQTNECSFKVRRHHRTFEPRTLAPPDTHTHKSRYLRYVRERAAGDAVQQL